MTSENSPKLDHLPDWIRQLRNQTWQIEILIAGSTVFTLFSLSDDLQAFFYKIYPGISFNLERTLILFGIYIVTRILLIGFVANLILRAVWLAYLGINFTFPNGVNFNNLKNNQESKNILKGQSSILERVTLLDRLSKLSYSLAILLAIFVTSVFISTLIIHILFELVGFDSIIYEAWFSYTVASIIAIIQFGILDRFFFSKTSKKPYINRLKKWLSTFLEYFTLSFLFRREILAIKSNTNKWAFTLSIVFVLSLASIITSYQIGKYWPYGTIKLKLFDDREFFDVKYSPSISIYDYDTNITNKTSVLRASIPEEVISGNYLKVFVTSWAEFDKKLKHGYEKYNYPLDYKADNAVDYYKTKELADSLFNLVLNDIFILEVDDITQQNLRWKTSNHPISKTKGYVTFINIAGLNQSEHKLNIYVNYFGKNDKLIRGRWKEINFWKE
ncbi:MAG: hypothetical protein P1U56_21900 [Saprospiraceae bacterium]|nr:hypothetical protein [Saprospiraceae bacterium]